MFQKSVVDQWCKVRKELEALKAEELELRAQITPRILGDKLVGSKTAVLNGVKLRATARLNYSLDIAELSLIQDQLSLEEQAAVEWKPSIKESIYNKLPNDSVLRTAVTVRPGVAGLTLA
jgi:hypothetical protein